MSNATAAERPTGSAVAGVAVLLVADDPVLRGTLSHYLVGQRFVVSTDRARVAVADGSCGPVLE